MRIGLDIPDDTRILSLTMIRDTDDRTLIETHAFKIKAGSIYVYELSNGTAEEVE